MEKEKVLEIEITKINDDWSVITITKLDETLEEENEMVKWNGYKDTEFDFNNKKNYINSYNPYQPFLISNENIRIAESIINEINQKYGIQKRWRAEYKDKYFAILNSGKILEIIDYEDIDDNIRYNLGNYFKTLEEAEKVKKELDKFWERVRNGEIGGEND